MASLATVRHMPSTPTAPFRPRPLPLPHGGDHHHNNNSDDAAASSLSPRRSPSPGGHDGGQGSPPLPGTPTRKNKRKLSEPRRRRGGSADRTERRGQGADHSGTKRARLDQRGFDRCPDSTSDSGCSDDGAEEGRRLQHRVSQRARRGSHDEAGSHSDREDEDTANAHPASRGSASGSGLSGGHRGPPSRLPFFPASLPLPPPFLPAFYLPDGRSPFPPPPPPPFPGGLALGLHHHHPHPRPPAGGGFPPTPDGGHSGGPDLYRSKAFSGSNPHHPLNITPLHHVEPQDLVRAESPDNASGDDDNNSSGGGGGGGGDDGSGGGGGRHKPRKNYKNMTRERRVEANARERTRVHTISAAFDALRRCVPAYSYNQKLSKLAILRIAATYIMALARLADVDLSNLVEPDVPDTFSDCVDLCTRTIQTEGRARRRH